MPKYRIEPEEGGLLTVVEDANIEEAVSCIKCYELLLNIAGLGTSFSAAYDTEFRIVRDHCGISIETDDDFGPEVSAILQAYGMCFVLPKGRAGPDACESNEYKAGNGR